MATTFDDCQLEIDADRGVIYVHGSKGITLVRVCNINPTILHFALSQLSLNLIDIVAHSVAAGGLNTNNDNE